MWIASQTDPLRIAFSEFDNYNSVNKFGNCADFDTGRVGDVWDGGQFAGLEDYTFSTSADIDTISSSSALDVGQTINIQGLDILGNIITQDVVTNGQNQVSLTTPLWRVFRMINLGTGVQDVGDMVGNFYCYVNTTATGGIPDVLANTRAMILAGNNQTEMAIYTTPASCNSVFYGGYVGITRTGSRSASFIYQARPQNGVFAVKGRVTCNSDGSSWWQYDYPIPEPVPPLTDIKIRCVEVSANNTGVVGGFSVLNKF